ncbi:GntR family transcriptional regulator [Bordetella pertussis]|nr:GntR family transcriptional regulator [Bordetella pertussis]CFO73686.1 GntR family transcriptional regulator [Bordetella pertussis]CFU84299.1 GntR family transcriptional regulator [Bordetella pertussis]CPI18548.1 GntR family transcriptional regulator [Bordetella pertussis]CPK77636.1 GntR family transcriptional regulator [Bordetella pertussis]
MLDLFLRLSWRRRVEYFSQPKLGKQSIIEHQEILNAVASGDTDAVSTAIRTHLNSAERFWDSKYVKKKS